MKKRIVLLSMCVLMSACASRQAQEPPAPVREALPETPPAPVYAQVDVSAEAPESAMEKAAGACEDLIAALPIPADSPYCPLTREQLEALLDRVAETGAPVRAEGYDLRNYEQVVSFAQAVEKGHNAQTGIFTVSENGLRLDTLAQNEGRQMFLTTASYFPCTQASQGTLTETTGIALEPGGYLMYGDPALEGTCGGYRVLPLGDEKREACRRYVTPVFGSAGKLTDVDWDAQNLRGLNMQFAFETLYRLDTGKILDDAGYPQSSRNFTYSVPAAEVERIMTKYLPVTADQLREYGYDPSQAVYHWGSFAGGGYAPTPEVVEIQENDGKLIITVNAVGVEFGESCSGQCILTIQWNPDGSFRYLSNRIIPKES